VHKNYYDHEESEIEYRKHISNIAFRFKFEVIYEDEQILKSENGNITVLSSTVNTPRNTLCWKAWLKLLEEYDYSGIWRHK
jgi:hypothetical protein